MVIHSGWDNIYIQMVTKSHNDFGVGVLRVCMNMSYCLS